MTTTSVNVFDKTVQTTHIWLKELAAVLTS
jgi:hypothetical protein